jgi:predicted metal-dependent hydrolase
VDFRTKQVAIGDLTVPVTYKPIRSLRIRVLPPNGEVRVSVPLHTSDKALREFLAPRQEWIVKSHRRMSLERPAELQVREGELHYLWGNPYALLVEESGKPGARVEGDSIILTVPVGATLERRRRILERWYRDWMGFVVPDYLQRWEQAMEVSSSGWSLRYMKTRWGTCNLRTGHIRLNLELVRRPLQCLEATIVHEVTHLLIPGHGPRFRAAMDRNYPAWRLARETLGSQPLSPTFWGWKDEP